MMGIRSSISKKMLCLRTERPNGVNITTKSLLNPTPAGVESGAKSSSCGF